MLRPPIEKAERGYFTFLRVQAGISNAEQTARLCQRAQELGFGEKNIKPSYMQFWGRDDDTRKKVPKWAIISALDLAVDQGWRPGNEGQINALAATMYRRYGDNIEVAINTVQKYFGEDFIKQYGEVITALIRSY